MKTLIDDIIHSWSNRIPSGIIDLKNEEHKFELLQVLTEKLGSGEVVQEIMRNIYNNN